MLSQVFLKAFALSIGPQASGTGILHAYFKSRREVVLPNVQEIFYFDRHMQRGAEFYKSHFQDRAEAKLFMELTTTAFDHPQAPARVKELLGADVKLFCPLRDPVERAAAVYRQYLQYGIVKGGIEEACEQAPQILHASRYSEHLRHWLDAFDNIHFVPYSALAAHKVEALKALCGFLGIAYRSERATAKMQTLLPKIWMRMSKKEPEQAVFAWLAAELEGEAVAAKALIGSHF